MSFLRSASSTFGRSCNKRPLVLVSSLPPRLTQYLPSLSQANMTRASASAASSFADGKVRQWSTVFAMNFSRAGGDGIPVLVNDGQVCMGEDQVCFALRTLQKHGHLAKGDYP